MKFFDHIQIRRRKEGEARGGQEKEKEKQRQRKEEEGRIRREGRGGERWRRVWKEGEGEVCPCVGEEHRGCLGKKITKPSQCWWLGKHVFHVEPTLRCGSCAGRARRECDSPAL